MSVGGRDLGTEAMMKAITFKKKKRVRKAVTLLTTLRPVATVAFANGRSPPGSPLHGQIRSLPLSDGQSGHCRLDDRDQPAAPTAPLSLMLWKSEASNGKLKTTKLSMWKTDKNLTKNWRETGEKLTRN